MHFRPDEVAFINELKARLPFEARQEFGEPEQFVLVLAMRKVVMAAYPPVTGDPHGERASGDCLCPLCGESYFAHPFDWRVIGYGNVPFLNVLCTGLRVKL